MRRGGRMLGRGGGRSVRALLLAAVLAAIPPLGAEAATLSAERSPDAVATHRPGLAVETGIAAPSGEIPENERRTDTGVVLVLLAGIGSGTAVMWAGAIRRGRRERE